MDQEFQTEFEFDLPKGYLDAQGALHRHGTMRLATAADEILPLRDPRVVQNPGYLTIILLSSGGHLARDRPQGGPPVRSRSIYSPDLAFLQNMYQQVNAIEPMMNSCVCPECGHKFEQPVNFTEAE